MLNHARLFEQVISRVGSKRLTPSLKSSMFDECSNYLSLWYSLTHADTESHATYELLEMLAQVK